MAYVLEASGAGDIATFSSPQSITLPTAYTTVANDCITLCISLNSTATTPTVSGCGGTWVVNPFTNNATLLLCIGYGCTAGGTAVSVTGLSGQAGSYSIGVFSGVMPASNPIRSVSSGNSAASSPVNSGNFTFAAGDLCIGMSGINSTANGFNVPAWNNITPGTNQNIAQIHGTVGCVISAYTLPTNSGSTGSVTFNNQAGVNRINAIALSLMPASTTTGDMFLVMGL